MARSLTTLVIAACVLGMGVCAPGASRAGAWTQSPGGWFLKFGYHEKFTNQRFDSTGALTRYRTAAAPQFAQGFHSRALRLYAEYGLTSSCTVAASSSYDWLESTGDGARQKSAGIAEPRVRLKWRLPVRPLAASLIGEVKVPLARAAARVPSLGTGEPDYGAGIAVGTSARSMYLTGEAGYVVRGGRFTDQAPFSAEAGWSASKDILVRGRIGGIAGTGRSPMNAFSLDPALSDSREIVGGVGLVLRGSPLDFSLEAERVLAGRNTLAGTRLELSAWISRSGGE